MTDHPPFMEVAVPESKRVSIRTHKLFLARYGPRRISGAPVVIVEAGLGDCSVTWPAVARIVSQFAPIYLYDRAGLGHSDPSPNPRTATVIAQELLDLLQAAEVEPPYVLVCHSYGGILGREFLALRPNDIVGMVMVDANQEKTEEEQQFSKRKKVLGAMMRNIDYGEVTGLNKDNKLTPEEWEIVKKGGGGSNNTGELEDEEMKSSAALLAAKGQLDAQVLGNRPLSVIRSNTTRDFRRIYDACIAGEHGTEEERETMKEWVDGFDAVDDRLQREQLRLSSCSRFVRSEESGHNMQLTHPELIAEEVRWVLDLCAGR